ncbi:Phosphoglycerate mutase-like protein AT74 [Glycine max]|nr:Phosphoglycerate mutase-like protein AT74 [Glycine max]
MVDLFPKRRILMRHGESQGNRNTTTYTTTSDIQSTSQGMTQTLRANEHLRRVMDNDSCSPD